MKYIDTHAHMNFKAYDEDRDEVIKRALDADVAMINVGTNIITSKKVVEIAEQYPKGVYAIIGLHPIHTNASHHDTAELGDEGKAFTSRGEDFDYEEYRKLAMHPKVVGIGECGLDYYHRKDSAATTADFVTRQKTAFEKQIQLAIEVDKPLMIHCREAYDDVLEILTSYKKSAGEKLRGNFHFFAGTPAVASKILDLSFTLSFTGVITFAKEYHELVRHVPIDRMHAETDCPYVTPVPYRGKRNEPLYVKEVVQAIADIKAEPLENVQNQLLANAHLLYNL